MIHIHHFTFGPFQENTYLLWDDTKEAVIIDPGNSNNTEDQQLKNFIQQEGLQLKRLLLTHAHVDHVNGNRFVLDTYGLLPEVHKNDIPLLERHEAVAAMYGLSCNPSPMAEKFIEDGDTIRFGQSELSVVFTPGHAPGHVTFYNLTQKFMISGDVLFRGSIGRTDLPGGNTETLLRSIAEKLIPLGDDMTVYSGHGPKTTIGIEKQSNPFLQ